MRLYKFRPLANSEDFWRLMEIIKTGKFWCSKFSELNDPMEGVFTTFNERIIDFIYSEKIRYKICSFSNTKAFGDPKMWGYYANGFRGVAVELEVNRKKVEMVNYEHEILSLENSPDLNVKKILTTKLSLWEHEHEYRFLQCDSTESEIVIGKIIAVCFGDPYWGTTNKRAIYSKSDSLKKYERFKNRVLSEIPKNIKVYSTKMEMDKVRKRLLAKP